MNLHSRPAEARDVSQAVPLIYSAGPEGFEYVFTQGRYRAHDYLAHAFAEGAGLFGCRNHRVIELGGQIAGIGAFYSGVEYNQLSQGTLRQILRFYGLSCLPVLRRAMQTTRWMPPPGRRTLYVANLGVRPELRGKGLGARLLHEQLGYARHTGKAKIALDVAVTNTSAQRLYERLGLRVVRENVFRAARSGIEVPASRRMELLL
jgi:ribosomal protein S18 acetylase RimI-like enzyme